MTKTIKEINELLKATRDQKFRKISQQRIDGYNLASANRRGQKRSDEQKAKMSFWQKGKPKDEETKKKIGDTLRGKTLEELLGAERAAIGRKKRSDAHKGKKRPESIGKKIASTRRANGTYENNGMTGRVHKDSTKLMQSQKAKVRQELKRSLGLGKSEKIPKELLESEYKRLGLQ